MTVLTKSILKIMGEVLIFSIFIITQTNIESLKKSSYGVFLSLKFSFEIYFHEILASLNYALKPYLFNTNQIV